MHTGTYGLMSADDSVQPTGPGGQEGHTPTWPIWSGSVPPLADGFTVRPDTVPGLETTLIPGATVALVPDQVTSVAWDWRGTSGKTQLARYFAESLWRSPGVDVLTWVVASSRASVLSGFVQAAAAMGASDAGDAESVAARFVDWLGKTSRSWLVVLDDLRDTADLRGLWPAGLAGRLLITTADPAVISAEHRTLALPVPAFSTREAMNYLSGRISTDPDQRSGAINLVGDLGCEPLALAQASAVIVSSGMSCRDYRQYFTQRQKQLVEAGRAETSAAAVTWTFSAEFAEHLSPGVSIRSLVTLAALLDGHGIPGAVFTTKAAGQFVMSEVAQPPDPQRSWNAVLSLKQAGLMAIDPPGTPPAVRISPVIQAAIRTAVPKDLYDRAARAAADALLEIWPRDEPRSRLAADLRSCAVSLGQAAGDVLWTDGRCHPLLLLAGQSMDSARLTGPAVAYWRELAAESARMLGSGSLEIMPPTRAVLVSGSTHSTWPNPETSRPRSARPRGSPRAVVAEPEQVGRAPSQPHRCVRGKGRVGLPQPGYFNLMRADGRAGIPPRASFRFNGCHPLWKTARSGQTSEIRTELDKRLRQCILPTRGPRPVSPP